MSPLDEPPAGYKELREQPTHNEDTEVTIKFANNGDPITIKASKEKLIDGSTYFAQHWDMHPRSSTIRAPKFIVPGVTIGQESIDAALGHLHGETIVVESGDVGDSVELILVARALGIPELEVLASKRIEQLIESSFDPAELAAAVRELYEGFREEPECAIGNEVVAVVTGIVAKVCRRRVVLLRSDPAFRMLLKDVPLLALDILEAVADEDEDGYVKKEMVSEERDSKSPQGSQKDTLEGAMDCT